MAEEDDRRQDSETRSRYDELKASFDRSVEEMQTNFEVATAAMDARLRWWTKAVVSIAVITLLASAIGYALLQGQRYDSIVDSCHARNDQATAIIDLLKDFGVPQPGLDKAKNRFPIEPNCNKYAGSQVGWIHL